MKEKIPYFTPEEIDLICYSMWLAVGCLDKKWEEKAKLIDGSPQELSEKVKTMTKAGVARILKVGLDKLQPYELLLRPPDRFLSKGVSDIFWLKSDVEKLIG